MSAEVEAGQPTSDEHVPAVAGDTPSRFQESLDREVAAERSVWRSVAIGMGIATPICIAIWIAIVAIAVGSSDPNWGIWLAMAAVIGLTAGVFFGGLFAFMLKAHILDDVDSPSHAGARAVTDRRAISTSGSSPTRARAAGSRSAARSAVRCR